MGELGPQSMMMKISPILPTHPRPMPIVFAGETPKSKAHFIPIAAFGLLYLGMAASYFSEDKSPPYAITLIHSRSGPPRVLKPDEKFDNPLKMDRLHVYSFVASPPIGWRVSSTSQDGQDIRLNLLYSWQLYPATAKTALDWDAKLQKEAPKALREATKPPTTELTAWNAWSLPSVQTYKSSATPNTVIHDHFIAPRIQAALITYARERTQAEITQEGAQNPHGLLGILFDTGFRDKQGRHHPPLRKVFEPQGIRFPALDHY